MEAPGHVPSVPSPKSGTACEIRKDGRWTQRYCVSNVTTIIIT